MYVWRINERDEIEHVNGYWRDFADENGAEALAGRVLGTRIETHLCGEEVRNVYRRLLERVRADGRVVSFPFRCDSPSQRRYLNMQIVPLRDGKVEFRSTIERVEERASVPMLNPTVEHGENRLRVCAWCLRVWISGWVDIEDAIVALDLFSEPAFPPITHGICEECSERVFQ